jgi:hypothetical protein
MPGKATYSTGNFLMEGAIYLPAVAFSTLGANASTTSTVTVPGLLPNDLLSWNLIAPPLHVQIDNAYVSAANTVIFTFGTDATGITGTNLAVLLGWARIDGGNLGVTSIPSAVV